MLVSDACNSALSFNSVVAFHVLGAVICIVPSGLTMGTPELTRVLVFDLLELEFEFEFEFERELEFELFELLLFEELEASRTIATINPIPPMISTATPPRIQGSILFFFGVVAAL